MLASEVQERLRALPVAAFDDLVPAGGLVVVAPHPDDESLGCGGLVAQAVARGRDVEIVFVSDGAGSHCHSRTYPPQALRDLREREARAAAGVLGVADNRLTFLRLPDGDVPSDGAEADRAAQVLSQRMEAVGANALFVTSDMDPHCDHKASFILARDAARRRGARLWSYVIWAWTLAPDVELARRSLRGSRLDVSAERDLKRQAIARHASQLTDLIDDDPTGFRLSEADVERCCGDYETFIEEPV